MNQNTTRRQFFTLIGSFVGAAVLAPSLLSSTALAEERRRRAEGAAPAAGGGDASLPMVDPKDSTAKAVNYTLDHKDVKDAALKVDRGGVPFEKQHCSACSFYTKAGTNGGKEAGKCTIFAGKRVEATAWCSTWNKKA